jgi:hypothetical protein
VGESSEYLEVVAEFIKLNTCIKDLFFNCRKTRDFSQELKFNNNIDYIHDKTPFSIYYYERNRKCFEIFSHFSNKKISEIKLFDFHFRFH